jgi:predicted transcriptional regulator
VSPRIKELIEHKLVKFEGKKYHLTTRGKVIVSNFRPFVDTINVFDQSPDFWNDHDLTSIPDEFLKRIGEINNFFIVEDDDRNINRTNIEIFNLIKKSKEIFIVSCVFEDNFPIICLNAAMNNIPISIILSKSIFDIMNNNFKDQVNQFISFNNAKLFVSQEDIKVSFIVTDDCLLFSMFYNNGKFDMHSNLISNDISSIIWGKDLFRHFLERSVRIGEINYEKHN